ncbi:5-hydroxytryptamine receptor 3A-like [Pseudophryne corroboree]|uniref:5-hydroxytryptamine receptor 3A-like n=1 Tax=Pseudophryne corroboree TaxID=495146 RepID=UPI00308177C1
MVEAIKEIGVLKARTTAMAVSARRSLWLLQWTADADSRKGVEGLPFTGKALFEDELDKWISTATAGTSHESLVCSYFNLEQNLTNDKDIPGANIRPARDWKTPTTVFIDMSLYTVITLDTTLQSLSTYIWFTMEWQNEFISWNPDYFCGIDSFATPGTNLWLPDLYIYELTDGDQTSAVIPYVFVSSDGLISDYKPMRIVSSCTLDTFKFPFDKQTCSLTFGSYIHTIADIVMCPKSNSSQVGKNTQDIFVSKGEWSLLDISVSNTTLWSEGSGYSQVIFTISLQRTPLIYILNIFIPACIFVLLDIISVFIHIGNGSRLNFKVTVILGFSVLLLILNDILPSSDKPPVLGIFCCVCLAVMVVSIMSTIATSYMLMLSETQPHVPGWIKFLIIRHLARILCFRVQSSKQDQAHVIRARMGGNDDGVKAYAAPLQWRKDIEEKGRTHLEVTILKRLLAEILQIQQDLAFSRNTDDKSGWYIAALIVDRLFLILHIIIVIVMFVVVICMWVT